MKLNYKRTIMVGFAFFLICAFWQAYDNTIPLILTNKFGMSQTWSGVIMALDNVLALFLLPLFGHISDKCTSRRGRRTPFIVIGTLIAAVALVCLSFVDNAQLKNLRSVSAIDDPAALTAIYQEEKDATLLTPSGEKFILGQKFTEEAFTAIRSQITDGDSTVTNPDYTNYVVPARQACAWQMTAEHPSTLIFFVVLLLIILVAMATFRSPAVALMPDVTLKPLRSKANAVINLMGSAGGILVLALGMVFATSSVRNSLMSYTGHNERYGEQLTHIKYHRLLKSYLWLLYEFYQKPHTETSEKEESEIEPSVHLISLKPVYQHHDNTEHKVRQRLIQLCRMFWNRFPPQLENKAPWQRCLVSVNLRIEQIPKPYHTSRKCHRYAQSVNNPQEIKAFLLSILGREPPYGKQQRYCATVTRKPSFPQHEYLQKTTPGAKIVIRLIKNTMTEPRTDYCSDKNGDKQRVHQPRISFFPCKEPFEEIPAYHEYGGKQQPVPPDLKSSDMKQHRIHVPMHKEQIHHILLYLYLFNLTTIDSGSTLPNLSFNASSPDCIS